MFILTEEQKKLRQELRDFADHEMLPQAASLEANKGFAWGIFKTLGEAGYLDVSFLNHRPEAKYTGVSSAIIMEEIARGLPSLTLGMSPHLQCMNLIALNGAESLRERIVPGALKGEHLLAFAISEASGGSDALGTDTTAEFDGEGWILNGEKCWITNLGAATGYIVSAKNPYSSRSRDVSLFYVDAATPGLETSRVMLTGVNNSPTGTVRMRNCHLPADCLVGRENDAYGLMKILLNEGRFDMAALAVGIAQGAMECAVQHSNRNGNFGRTLSSYQGISFQVARMYEKIFVARSTLYQVARLFEQGERATPEVAALKLFASEMCLEVTRSAVQVLGARGLVQYSDVERYFRDAQMLTIGEGSSEVCQIVISRRLYHSEPGIY